MYISQAGRRECLNVWTGRGYQLDSRSCDNTPMRSKEYFHYYDCQVVIPSLLKHLDSSHWILSVWGLTVLLWNPMQCYSCYDYQVVIPYQLKHLDFNHWSLNVWGVTVLCWSPIEFYNCYDCQVVIPYLLKQLDTLCCVLLAQSKRLRTHRIELLHHRWRPRVHQCVYVLFVFTINAQAFEVVTVNENRYFVIYWSDFKNACAFHKLL